MGTQAFSNTPLKPLHTITLLPSQVAEPAGHINPGATVGKGVGFGVGFSEGNVDGVDEGLVDG